MKRLLIALLFCSSAFAEPINIIMPVLAGGNVDVFARALSKVLTESDIDNITMYHPGANGDIAYSQVANKFDTSILIAPMHVFVLSHVSQNRDNFHTKNMKIIGPMVETPFVFVTSANGFNSFSEMIKYAKTNELLCGTSGAASIELLRINKEYNTKFQPVPYKGTAQLKTDLLGGHIKCGYDGAGAYAQEHDAKSLKYLASNMSVIKGVPHIDTVLPQYKFQMWFGIAIMNDSKLLKNEKLMNAITKINLNKDYIEKLSQHNLYAANISNKINDKVEKLTEHYRSVQ